MYIRKYENPKFDSSDDYYKHDGISILFIGGVHGNEINTILGVGAMAKMPVPCHNMDAHIREVGFIPCVNIDALRTNARGFAGDASDLNRGWKDSDYRSQLQEIMSDYDMIIDCHCSEDISPLFYLSTHQPATDVCALIRYFEREKLNYALSTAMNDTIKTTHTFRSFYHPMCGNYRKQLTLTWEENGMSYNSESIESTKRMIEEMLSHYAYTIYRDALVQELIDTPPVSEFRTLGFVQAVREGVYICNAGKGHGYNHPIMVFDPGEKLELGLVREFSMNGKYGDDHPVYAEYLKSDVELRIFEIENRGKYVLEGMSIAAYQPSNADKFPTKEIRDAAHTYIPREYSEYGVLQLSEVINRKKRQ